jgi:hypothetical protein
MIRGGGHQGSGSKHSEESPESQTDDRHWFRGCAPGWGSGEGRVAARGPIRGSTYDTELPPTTKGWMDFYQAAEIHWKWPAIDPQHPRKSREPPPGHAFNVHTVTNSEVRKYATTVMGLDTAGAIALLALVGNVDIFYVTKS